MKTLSSPIAQGRTAEIYAWDDQHILKLFREWWPSKWVDYEAGIARAVHAAGVPSPAPGEIVEINGRHGLIYERLEGISMLQEMNARPWLTLKNARLLAELQAQIHQRTILGLPAYKERLAQDIRNTSHLREDQRERVLALLATLPDDQKLCHGDFHPGNILLTKRGPVIIDWLTACTGSPWADVARTLVIGNVGVKTAGDQISPVTKMFVRLYFQIYRNHYNALLPDTQKLIQRWIPVVAAARLNEDIALEREALRSLVVR
ncbi:MAG TPA: aminoglycoside phosphotransferase family protein [Anaerolineales bacterium]|nr:aminoglycoside phosphotransferase family protein [Anaerolineales bacterium]